MTAHDIRTHEDRSIKAMARLKEDTREYHARLESLLYFKALIDHKLPLESYVNQLHALAVIHVSDSDTCWRVTLTRLDQESLQRQIEWIGRLLVASVVDEKKGIKGVFSALREWVTDEARFPDNWISGVKDIISKTMEIASNPNH